VLPLAFVLLVALGAAARVQLGFWKDSVTLWTRAAALDPQNDVALYNLALALQEAGDPAGAEARLKETVALVPDHEPARRLLATLEARRLEQEAGALAAAGHLPEAVELLSRVLGREPGRMRAYASRGMVLAELERFEEATTDLRAALAQGNDEVEVIGALAYCLAQMGRGDEAVKVLVDATLRHPEEPRLRATLATLEAASGKGPRTDKKSPGR
jgi:Flp pilus assembly protein TadD